MKIIYNTLTTAKSIENFLTDGGKITVAYYSINSESDFHNVSNIKSITCNFHGVITEMNRFFLTSLFSVATPRGIDVENGLVCVKFDLRETFDSFEHFNNESKLINTLFTMVENAANDITWYEEKLDVVNNKKRIYDILSTYKRYSNKFIDSLRGNTEMVDLFATECIYFEWYTNDEIREMFKTTFTVLCAYFHDVSYEDYIEYYTKAISHSMEYIA